MSERRIVNEKTGGMKGSKQENFALLPWEQLAEVAKVYEFGAHKYDPHNWRRGYDWDLCFASLMRHATAWWEGEYDDPESGCDHMASVVFHALSLMFFRKYHQDLDTRWHASIHLGVGSRDEENPDSPNSSNDAMHNKYSVSEATNP